MKRMFILNFCSNPVKSVLMLIFLMISFSVLNTAMYINDKYGEMTQELRSDTALVDVCIDIYSGFGDLYKDEGGLNRLKMMYKKLASSDLFRYYEIYTQFMYVLNYDGPPEFKYGYDAGYDEDNLLDTPKGKVRASRINCVQVSKNCFDIYNMKLLNGRYFSDKDYLYTSEKPLPVIMGYEYRDYYKIGDVLKGDYIAKKLDLEIVGFLKKDSHIRKGEALLYLDRYIVMPIFECTEEPSDLDERVFQVRHYANKTSGYLKLMKGTVIGEVPGIINSISASCGLDNYSVWHIPYSLKVDFLTLSNEYMAAGLKYLGYILMAVFFILFIILFIKSVRAQTKIFAAYIISGASLKSIQHYLLLEISIFILTANIVGVLVTTAIFRLPYYSIYLLFVSILLLGIIALIIVRTANSGSISQLLLEENKNVD
ncbi:hypothetical protein DFR58_10140 [Anaerobacterium chartisolvens]|uniref:FtsX-like permease family protein n=1 Tax=Anaerobacterium chartisolvens TaxID=1297424 RepID=A0A369BJR6_9FIRM|nr:hypothetical protein [Anaerobacterium chartisolvens]RCX20838.1 hypothetical protein DFR58_10140 [Anaerobacterium chartisolvens]